MTESSVLRMRKIPLNPGDDQDPRDQNGNFVYDRGVTLKLDQRVHRAIFSILPEIPLKSFPNRADT